MTNQLLILALGIALSLNPTTIRINPHLFKGAAWLFNSIVSRLLK